jgi:pilus assembly protein CpaD
MRTTARLALITKPSVLALFSAMVLAGCASDYRPPLSSLDRFPIEVQERTEFLEINVQGGGLAPADQGRVMGFLDAYRREGSGPMVVTVPTGSANAAAAAQGGAQARAMLEQYGLLPAQIVGGPYDATGDQSAPLILAYRSYTAIAPDCPPIYTFQMSVTRSNDEYPGFGCTQAANLAAMVSNPADLAGPRAMDAVVAERRMIVYEKYVQGEPTGAQRTDDESGSVSQAVQ